MKLSATGKKQFEECQRAFFHERVKNTPKDSDYIEPVYFHFGKAAHRCLEEFKYHGINMVTQKVFDICKEEGLQDKYDAARVAIALRTYFAEWPETHTISVEGWLETEFFHGRFDAIVKDEKGYWILENKFHSQISKDIGTELVGDVQLCSYAARAKDIEANLKLDAPLIGVKYRVTTKNSQTVGGKRTQYSNALEFLGKASNGKTIEMEMRFDEMAVGIVETEMSLLCCDIESKGFDEQLFTQSLDNCIRSEKKAEACPFYSQCHNGLLYSEQIIDF